MQCGPAALLVLEINIHRWMRQQELQKLSGQRIVAGTQ